MILFLTITNLCGYALFLFYGVWFKTCVNILCILWNKCNGLLLKIRNISNLFRMCVKMSTLILTSMHAILSFPSLRGNDFNFIWYLWLYWNSSKASRSIVNNEEKFMNNFVLLSFLWNYCLFWRIFRHCLQQSYKAIWFASKNFTTF